jgi:two-component system LytT family response regulator
VIFVTAYDEHALRAFEARALDYVVKPVATDRLRSAVDRAARRVLEARALRDALESDRGGPHSIVPDGPRRQAPAPGVPVTDAPATDAPIAGATRLDAAHGGGYLTQLLVRDRDGTTVVRVEEIDWVEADTYYVRLHTGSRSRLLRERMHVLEARLDPAMFFRAHRSAIVRLDRVRAVNAAGKYEHVVILASGARVPLSRDRRARLEVLLAGHPSGPRPRERGTRSEE